MSAALPTRAERANVELSRRLEARREEIEEAVLHRVQALAEGPADPDYQDGLRGAVGAAIDHWLAGIERGGRDTLEPPLALLAQARLAARSGIKLDTVLRRYFAGYSLLGDFLIEEARAGGLIEDAALQRLLRNQAALFDRLLAAVSEEYGRAAAGQRATSEERRVERLLAGELIDTAGLDYDFEGEHLGVVAVGSHACRALPEAAKDLDRRILVVQPEEDTVWAWFGGRYPVDPEALAQSVSAGWAASASLAIGEPAKGLAGWRLTHRQARTALTVALRGKQKIARYADVALLASLLQDDLLVASLRKLYLEPLRLDGEVARETLHAYFAAERHTSSTAAALGVNRHTVTSRLRAIERRVGRSLASRGAEFELALRLDSFEDASPSTSERAARQ